MTLSTWREMMLLEFACMRWYVSIFWPLSNLIESHRTRHEKINEIALQVWLPYDADEDELCQQAWIRVQWLHYIIEGLTCRTCMFIWLRRQNDKNLKLQCSVLPDECAWSFILISHEFPGEVKRINWKPINMSLPSDLNGSSSSIQSLVTMDFYLYRKWNDWTKLYIADILLFIMWMFCTGIWSGEDWC